MKIKIIFFLYFIFVFSFYIQAEEIHRWKLDETSGSIVYDSIGNINGTIYGGTFSNGSAQFDGVNDYVALSSTVRLHDEQNWTISVWYKGSTAGTDWTGATLLGTIGNDWWASMAITDGKAKYLHATDNGYQTSYDNLTGTSNVTDNQWHNIIIRNYSNRTADVIVDGVVEVSGSSLLAGTPSQDVMSFRLDYFMVGSPGIYASGSLKDVRVFNTAITDQEVASIAGGAVPEPFSLVLLLFGVLGYAKFRKK